jgi:ABC-type transport system substrate-binding protein
LKKILLVILLILVTGVMLIGSCGKETKPSTTGGILRGIITAGPLMMSYRGQMGPGDHTYVMPAVEYLVEPYVDEQGNRGWTPFLCESYKIDLAAKTFTFKLRKGVKFHDGSVMNADVVKWNFQQQIDSGWLQDADKITSIDTPDDSTVVIHFTEYSNQYEFNWGWTAIWSKQAWMDATGGDATTTNEKGIAWAVDHVVGTGPFVLKEYKRDVNISWVKFDDYWQKGKPYLEGLEFQIITESTTASSLLQAGDIDLWYQGNAAQDWAELAPKGYVVKTYWPGLPQALWGNTIDPDSKWQDKRVREALEYAVDKDAMAKALGLGYYVAQPQIAPSTEWGYIPDLAIRKYNPEKAKQLLLDAGYTDGCPVKLMIQSVPASIDAGQTIKGYLDAAGFKVELDIADPGRFFGSVFGTGWEDLVLMFYGMDVNYLATYMSWFSSDPKSNLASFARPPEQVAMDKKAVLVSDTAGQKKMTEDLCRYLYEEARVCTLWWTPAATVSQSYVHHEIYRHGFIRVDWENVWMDAH